jgi:hypothetical protein
MKVDGSCHCGYIRFEAEADPEKTRACHCTDCQRLTGSAFRVVVSVPEQDFRLLSGEPTLYEKLADSGAKRIHAFCPRCGASVYATSPPGGPKAYGLRVGTLAQRAQFRPTRQFWCRSAYAWADIPGAERFEKQ